MSRVQTAEAVIYLVSLAAAVIPVCGMGLLMARACRRGSAPLRHGILVGTLALVLFSPAAVWLAQQKGVALIRVTISSSAGKRCPRSRLSCCPASSRSLDLSRRYEIAVRQ
jgi:hypothetical protein